MSDLGIEAMDVEPVSSTTTPQVTEEPNLEEEEEPCNDLKELLESAQDETSSTTTSRRIEILSSILLESQNRYGSKASSIKEQSVYALAKAYCNAEEYDEVVNLLTGSICQGFFDNVTKAKCAKVVRGVLEAVCTLSPDQFEMQAQICRNIIQWAKSSKRTFLRQRVEAKLASILFSLDQYSPALNAINQLLVELKKLDDKQLLVETHLVESKIHHGLRNIPKAKSALTASRTAANAIYVSPSLQSQIDSMSGVLHCEESDYETAHSYFLEAFEQLDQVDEKERAMKSLKYMMLCRILHSLGQSLKLSAAVKGGGGGNFDGTSIPTNKKKKGDLDITNIVSAKQGMKYTGTDIEAMKAIVSAASKRSLKEFEATTQKYANELQDDILIKHHLHILHQQLLESNLIRIIEPYSCVETVYVARMIELPLHVVEKKLSQMILDGKCKGILDQGKGQLIVYEENKSDLAMEKGLHVIENMDKVVTSLFESSRALRTMMM